MTPQRLLSERPRASHPAFIACFLFCVEQSLQGVGIHEILPIKLLGQSLAQYVLAAS